MKNALKSKIKSAGIAATAALAAHLAISWYDPAVYYSLKPPIPKADQEFKFELNGSTTELQKTHSELEAELGFKVQGQYTDEQISRLWNTIKNARADAPKMLTHLEKIIILPESINPPYGGKASHNSIVLSEVYFNITVHELAHVYSLNLPHSFWSRWEEISKGKYEFNELPWMFYVANRFEDSPFAKKQNDSEVQPHDGFVSEYGAGNKWEDVATFVEDVFDRCDQLQKVPIQQRELYAKKLKLLEEFGFISPLMYKVTEDRISINTQEYANAKLEGCLPLPPPQILAIMPHGLAVYKSDAGQVSISYGANRGGSGLFIETSADYMGHTISIPFDIWGEPKTNEKIPKVFYDELKAKGYFDRHNYAVITVPVLNKESSLEELAQRYDVPKEKLQGPVPYTSYLADTTFSAYYYFYD